MCANITRDQHVGVWCVSVREYERVCKHVCERMCGVVCTRTMVRRQRQQHVRRMSHNLQLLLLVLNGPDETQQIDEHESMR